VPAIALNTDPLLAALAIGVGSTVGVLVTVALSARFLTWLTTKLGRDSFIGTRTNKFMAKYGTRGLGLLSPLILGPVLTCAGAMALGANGPQLARWGVAGVWLWAAGVYLVLSLGSDSQLLQVVR
jgi:hypothetical protein